MGVMLCMAFKILLHLSQVGLNFLREYFDKSGRSIYFVVSPKPPNACFGLAYPIFLTTPRGSQPDSSNNTTLVSVKVTSYLLFSCPEVKNQEWAGRSIKIGGRMLDSFKLCGRSRLSLYI